MFVMKEFDLGWEVFSNGKSDDADYYLQFRTSQSDWSHKEIEADTDNTVYLSLPNIELRIT